MDWTLITPIIGVIVVGFGIYVASAQKYFTIREHLEFKAKVEREVDIALENIIRELDIIRGIMSTEFNRIHQDITRLEDTRPTTGELQARLGRHKEEE